MANQDFKPVADGYRTRWAQAGDEDFEGEVATQQQYLFQEEIKEAFGKRFKVRDVDRVSACKCLCALASHAQCNGAREARTLHRQPGPLPRAVQVRQIGA